MVTRKDLTNINIHRKLSHHSADESHASSAGGGGHGHGGGGHHGEEETHNPIRTMVMSKSAEDLQRSHSEAIDNAGLDQGIELTSS